MQHLMDQSLTDYIALMRDRYGRMTGKRARSRLLDEFCKITDFERKYAIKVLSGRRRIHLRTRRGAKPTYTTLLRIPTSSNQSG